VGNNREIANDRNASVNSGNARNKAGVVAKSVVAGKSVVAVNKAVVSKAADKARLYQINKRREATPAVFARRFCRRSAIRLDEFPLVYKNRQSSCQ
jgi:hypothetical protein